MKTGPLMLSAVACVAMAACVPPGARHAHWSHRGDPLKPVSRLDCPDSTGDLKLKTAAADGKSCAYSGDGGEEVDVTLTPVAGTPDATLDPIEAQLKTLLPPPSAKPPTPSKSGGGHDHDNVNITLPGVSVHAANESANIRVGPLHIEADGDKDNVHISRGGETAPGKGQFTIDASNGGAIIRASAPGPDVRSTVILTSDDPGPLGWRVVGYEAHGPKAGPLVVATVKSKSDAHDQIFEDVKRLVRRTAGG